MVKIGVVGTSWWTDAMYLPALVNHPQAEVVAVCGRNRERAEALAARWHIPQVYTDFEAMIADGRCQALIIVTPNDTHYPIAMKALDAGLHLLCEKPLALTYAQAQEMADLATAKGVTHMVPFTYRFMPTSRYLKELIDSGYLGRPYHLNMRYYASYGRAGDYRWRFDKGKAGAGALGDIGSHFLYLGEWYFGQIVGVRCQLGWLMERPLLDPEGQPYEQTEDTAIVTLTFANGAHGVVHVTTLAYEDTTFGQTHHMEFHGSEGTLYHFIDWDEVQRVSGARVGEGKWRELPVPERIWGQVRRDKVHHTYQDVFREEDFMARGFVTAVDTHKAITPNFHDGARIQRIIEAALLSDREKRYVAVDEVQGT